MWKPWIFFGCLLIAFMAEVCTLATNEKDNMDTFAGDTFTIRTWTYSEIPLYFAISKDNITFLTASVTGRPDIKNAGKRDNEKDRMMLQYDDITKKISLVLVNSSRNDEGLYRMDENKNKTLNDSFNQQAGIWIFQLNVFDPDEMKQSNVGENITIMQFNMSDTIYHRLFYYDQFIAKVFPSECSILNTSHLYGRLKCIIDMNAMTYRIEIHNVTQRDTGLYKMVYYMDSSTERCFINITDILAQSIATIYTIYTENSTNNTYDQVRPLQPGDFSTRTPNIATRNTSSTESSAKVIILIFMGSFGVISLLLCCLIRIRRKTIFVMEPDQTHAQEECGSDFYLTPVGEEMLMPIPLVNDGRNDHSDSSQNPQFDSSLRLSHMTPRMCTDIYETVNTSCNDDSERTSKNEGKTCKENTCQATEIMNNHIRESSGYLTVLVDVDTSV